MYFYISYGIYNTFCLWNITTKINFSQPGSVNVILQTVHQIDATQNKAVPDDSYARLFKAASSCWLLFSLKNVTAKNVSFLFQPLYQIIKQCVIEPVNFGDVPFSHWGLGFEQVRQQNERIFTGILATATITSKCHKCNVLCARHYRKYQWQKKPSKSIIRYTYSAYHVHQ